MVVVVVVVLVVVVVAGWEQTYTVLPMTRTVSHSQTYLDTVVVLCQRWRK